MIEFYMPKKVVLADDFTEALLQSSKDLMIRHLFILYSESALKADVINKLVQHVDNAQLKMTAYPMPKGEPTFLMLNEVVTAFIQQQCDGIVAVGGGSSIDLAKAVSAIAKDSSQQFKELATYSSINRYPFIAIPTTAGTGSEATKVTVLTDEAAKVKYNPGHPQLIPDVAILIPSLTMDVPRHITAQTGLDALTHAIEAYVSIKANELSDFYALQAIQLIGRSLQQVYLDGLNLAARKNMLLGSFYAGVAFSNASTNLAHATGRALGTRWDLPHGLSVALMHPFVVDFSYESCKEKYERIANMLDLQSGEKLSNYLLTLNEKLGIWENAAHLRDDEFLQSIGEMTTNALAGNGITTNRRIPNASDIQSIFTKLFTHLNKLNSVQS